MTSCGGAACRIDHTEIHQLALHPSFDAWETCEFELLYLVSKSDPEAVTAAVRVLPNLCRSDQKTHRDWLATTLWEESDPVPDLITLPDQDLTLLVRYFDRTMPLDWPERRREIMAKRPRAKPDAP
jgi:hypothetical protein